MHQTNYVRILELGSGGGYSLKLPQLVQRSVKFENYYLEKIHRASQPKRMSLDFDLRKVNPERPWIVKRSGKGEGRKDSNSGLLNPMSVLFLMLHESWEALSHS